MMSFKFCPRKILINTKFNSIFQNKLQCLNIRGGVRTSSADLMSNHMSVSSPPLMCELLFNMGSNGRLSPSSMAMMSTQLQMQSLLQSHVLSPNQLQSLLQQQLLHHKVWPHNHSDSQYLQSLAFISILISFIIGI